MNVRKDCEKPVTYYFNSLNIGPKASSYYAPSPSRAEGAVGRFNFLHAPTEYE